MSSLFVKLEISLRASAHGFESHHLRQKVQQTQGFAGLLLFSHDTVFPEKMPQKCLAFARLQECSTPRKALYSKAFRGALRIFSGKMLTTPGFWYPAAIPADTLTLLLLCFSCRQLFPDIADHTLRHMKECFASRSCFAVKGLRAWAAHFPLCVCAIVTLP